MNKTFLVAIATSLCATAQASNDVQAGTIRATTATLNEACSTIGMLVTDSDGTGRMPVCKNGTFDPVGGPRVVMATATDVRDEELVKEPACARGSMPTAFVDAPADMAGATTGTAEYSLRKDDGGWRVSIVRVRSGGSREAARDLVATVKTACVL
ncbi:MAG: hypothetical protein RXR20_00890 [Paraburkholderia sp.]|jgi:hypothetical protein|uniref:hypothetical protein n=1 Tax=Burkholderiaceae TaxID=119060 RepID=UPI0010FA03F5|nr:hypothetical protein [Burkholderia sp. 4M9327F10]